MYDKGTEVGSDCLQARVDVLLLDFDRLAALPQLRDCDD